MLLSLLTPTHDTTYLLQLGRTIAKQQLGIPFEWILLPNAGPGKDLPQIPQEIAKDPRVRILPPMDQAPGNPSFSVGALKRACCDAARGDLFVEVDHDDLLAPHAFRQLVEAAEKTPDAFYYSDCAYFNNDPLQSPFRFSTEYGWKHYPAAGWSSDPPRLAHEAFDVTPRTLCELPFAPDHIRCWSRKAYVEAGGHDPRLGLSDDHDLMIRTYLAGIPFVHIENCLYFYRYHGDNTSLVRNNEIQLTSSKLRVASLPGLIAEWVRRHGEEVYSPEPGDYWELGRQSENSVGHVTLRGDFLPMLTAEQATLCFNAVWRMLKPGGYLSLIAPYAHGSLSEAPHYRSRWNRRMLDYYTEGTLAKCLPGNFARFQLLRYTLTDAAPDTPEYQQRYLHANLMAVKDGVRLPGFLRI